MVKVGSVSAAIETVRVELNQNMPPAFPMQISSGFMRTLEIFSPSKTGNMLPFEHFLNSAQSANEVSVMLLTTV